MTLSAVDERERREREVGNSARHCLLTSSRMAREAFLFSHTNRTLVGRS